jgi:hypothetical protein
MLSPKRKQKHVKQRNREPEQDGANKETDREGGGRELRDGELNPEQKSQDEYAHLDQPGQPIPLIKGRLHCNPGGLERPGFKGFKVSKFQSRKAFALKL